MLDDNTTRTRIIRAALRLAESRGWQATGLADIAREAGVTIAEMRREFSGKRAILRAFARELDRTVLRQAEPDSAEPARDRIFEVLMTRFEVMAPFKTALRAIARDMRAAPLSAAALLETVATSQYWMLNAAGVDTQTPMGALKVPGISALYARVMHVWLEDDDPGNARTMAALDRELRRGERAMRQAEGAAAALMKLGGAVRRVLTGAGGKARPPSGRAEPPKPFDDDVATTRAAGPGPTAAGAKTEPNGSARN
jgi:AcrR family transcriptional regulator